MSTVAVAPSTQELVLGRYRPVRPLGSGGSGSVWLALDERSGLDVALKIIPREGKAAARAEREALAARRLRHDRCVRSYDVGHDSSHVYIAYEYVPGRTLREALRSGELTDEDVVEVAAQVLDALAHAHRAGIVHRDVKPSNILLENQRRARRPAPRLRARPVRRGRHAHRRRRRPRDACLHRARAPRGRGRDGRERRLVGRRAPLGGALGAPSLLGRPAPGGRGGDPGGSAAPRHGAERPPPPATRRGRRRALARPRQATASLGARGRAQERPSQGAPPGGDAAPGRARRRTHDPCRVSAAACCPSGSRCSRPAWERRSCPSGRRCSWPRSSSERASAPGSTHGSAWRSPSRPHCSRSVTRPRAPPCCTRRSRSAGSCWPGATLDPGSCSCRGRSSPRSACWRSCPWSCCLRAGLCAAARKAASRCCRPRCSQGSRERSCR